MSEKIVVPEGMLEAAASIPADPWYEGNKRGEIEERLEVALRWLSENPIVPTDEQIRSMSEKVYGIHIAYPENPVIAEPLMALAKEYLAEFQRRMFLELEPEVPEVADLVKDFRRDGDAYNAVLEAYRRGQKSKDAK